MVKEKKPKNISNSCPKTQKGSSLLFSNSTEIFDWDEVLQNRLLLAYNTGYLIAHIPGALLSTHFGLRRVMICIILLSTLLTFISIPVAHNSSLFFVVRFFVGLVNGSLYPIIHETIANHATLNERTWFTMLTHTGNIMSLILTFPLGGYLVEYIPNGWKYIFIFSGCMGICSLILWTTFVFNTPEENPWMSITEIQHVQKSLGKGGLHKKSISSIPFLKILSCPQIYILSCAHFGKLFILYMNLFGLVKYLYSAFDLTRFMAGNLAVIPFIADIALQLVYSKSVDILKNFGWSITRIRKFNTFIGALGCSTFLIIAGFIPCNNIHLAIFILALSLLFIPPYQAGYFTSIIEIAPPYSGINMAIINVFGSLSGVIQRAITGNLLKRYENVQMAYRYSFLITGGVSFLLSMVFVAFGSSKPQPWSVIQVDPEIHIPISEDTIFVEE